MKLQISKSVYIVEVEEDYGVDHHFAVYETTNEPFTHNSLVGAYSEFCVAEAEAVNVALELKEELI